MTYTVFKYETGAFFDKNFKPQIIKVIDIEIDVCENIEIDGKVYSICVVDPANKMVGVHEITLNQNPNKKHGTDFCCPYCDSVDYDAWEYSEDEGEVECGRCFSDLKYKRDATKLEDDDWYIEYTVYPVKMKEPIVIK